MTEKPAYEELEQRVKELEREAIEQKRSASQLQRRSAELEHSDQKLRQFVHSASSDLQGSLDVVIRYLQFVEARYKGRLDSDANEFIASAVDGASRMQRIITDLFAYLSTGIRRSERDSVPEDGD
jgi:light-regulated signal transduction histidine kinase (bacteriophytochrome)